MHSSGAGNCRERLKVSKWLYAANPPALGFQTGRIAAACTGAVDIDRRGAGNNEQQRPVQAHCER